ncbi:MULTISPECIES: PleD family two-component system response regulator [unclassified Hahella]|uniref:response regulator n=1 Tax=unclassified Hahella TaxID=2624107 RepID=UPI001C1EFC09|nr:MULTISPECIES: response regulator [unclassified Hahella]MBU6955669.1 response regulator [Hahella sp. HN01]MDG9668069.1 response regulator [Hahella sp. CR1]
MAQKTALIVDDSATARIMLAKVLNSMDVKTRQASSGEEALKLVPAERPDLIFLDHLMPGMDGFQTLKALKQNPETNQIPVIMYTSQNAMKYQEEAKALGAAGVITKQVERERLYLLVEHVYMQQELARTEASVNTVAEAIGQTPMSTEQPAAPRKVVPLRPGQQKMEDHVEQRIASLRSELETQQNERYWKPLEELKKQNGRLRIALWAMIVVFILTGLKLNSLDSAFEAMQKEVNSARQVLNELIAIMEET